jgi:hypothetical protein
LMLITIKLSLDKFIGKADDLKFHCIKLKWEGNKASQISLKRRPSTMSRFIRSSQVICA